LQSHSQVGESPDESANRIALEKSGYSLKDLHTPLYGLFILGIFYTLYAAHQIVLPIILAVLASLLLYPLVVLAHRYLRVPRFLASLVLVLALLAAIAGVGWAVVNPAIDWAQKAPDSLSKLLTGQSEFMHKLDQVSDSAEKVRESMKMDGEESRPPTVVVRDESWLKQMLSKASSAGTGLALALALTYFLLVGGDRLIRNFVRQLPKQHRGMALRIVSDSQHQIVQYLAVISASNLLVGILTGLMCWALGLPTPAVWGLVAGLARFIPYLGVIITVLLLTVISAASLDNFWMIAIAPAGYMALTSLVGFFIEPWIHGFRMAINPVIIFVSIFFWGWLWGPVGVLLAVPLMTIIQVILKQIPRLRPIYRVIAR